MVGLPELSLQSSHTDTGMRQVKLSRMDWKGTISGGIGDLCVGGRTEFLFLENGIGELGAAEAWKVESGATALRLPGVLHEPE